MKRIERWKVISLLLAVVDIFSCAFSYILGLYLRFDFLYSAIPEHALDAYKKFLPLYIVIVIVVYWFLHLYKMIWRYIGYDDLIRVIAACFLTTTIHNVGITVMFGRMPVAYYIVGTVCQTVLTVMSRFIYRVFSKVLEISKASHAKDDCKNVMIIGAGEAGQLILKDIRRLYTEKYHIACIIDDNKEKWNRSIEGVPVVGGKDDIFHSVEKYHINVILFAIPSASPEEKREILNLCNETSCQVKTIPGIQQFVKDEVTLASMKDVAIEDLLGRDPIKVDLSASYDFVNGKTILVTGGGGSIGSELCRQIAAHGPKQLIIFDVYENNAYAIEQELKSKYKGELNLVVLIGSVRDSRRINMVFEQYHPDVVYHAAAHKHVPLMETSPNEAIKNNVVGTYKTAYAALMNGCKRFVLISTDKAVNPTNIMGASKRLCEMVVQTMDAISKSGTFERLPLVYAHRDNRNDLNDEFVIHKSGDVTENKVRTEFVAVRFGNVLGSNGSVIPLFKKQIENGGPVTVTHPDIIRYFMTIPEAVSLVLQAGVKAKGGEIFVLDMGAPVKIDTLARNLIKLSGHVPDKDIKIVYTGLRDGEKLYEEKLMAEEGLKKTDNDLIHVAKPIAFNADVFLQQLQELTEASYNNSDDIVERVEKVVVTFHPSGKSPVVKVEGDVKSKIEELSSASV